MKKLLFLTFSLFSSSLWAYEEEGAKTPTTKTPSPVPQIYAPTFSEQETPVPGGDTPTKAPSGLPEKPAGVPGTTGLRPTPYRNVARSTTLWDEAAVHGNLGIVMDGQAFGAEANVWLPFDRYFSVLGGGQYNNRMWDDDVMIRKTYHVSMRAQFPNSTIYLPFASLGPGYQVWERKNGGEIIESGATTLLNQKIGVQINLAPFFALTVQGSTWYMRTPTPELYSGDQDTRRINALEAMFSFVI